MSGIKFDNTFRSGVRVDEGNSKSNEAEGILQHPTHLEIFSNVDERNERDQNKLASKVSRGRTTINGTTTGDHSSGFYTSDSSRRLRPF
jgi:hypothetical protein